MKPKHTIQLSIPQPCSQDWEQMMPDAQGRFCAHCQKSVIDFTTWSDADLYAFFSENNQSVCGRFEAQQLNRAIQLPVQKPTRLYCIAIALGLSLMFTQLPATHARPKPPLTEQNMLVPQELPQNDSTGSDSLVIKGVVLDATKQPAINAVVNVIQNDETIGGALTDIDGNFQIVLRQATKTSQLKLKVSYTGHISTEFRYSLYERNMILQLKQLNALGVVDKVIIYKRPILDNTHPGPNTTFSREQINNTAH